MRRLVFQIGSRPVSDLAVSRGGTATLRLRPPAPHFIARPTALRERNESKFTAAGMLEAISISARKSARE